MSHASEIVDARKAILGRLDAKNLPREILIEAVIGGEGYDRETVEHELAELKKAGEVYVVNGEVRRT